MDTAGASQTILQKSHLQEWEHLLLSDSKQLAKISIAHMGISLPLPPHLSSQQRVQSSCF